MKSDLNTAWKALPLKQRAVLSLLLMMCVQGLFYLLFELPQGGKGPPLGGITALAALLVGGAGFFHYSRKWMNGSGENDANAAAAGRARRLLGTALGVGVVVYLLVLAFPHPLFPHTLSYRDFTVHSDQPLGREMHPVLDRASARIASSAVHDSTAHHTIFLSGSRAKFALFARENFRAFGIRSPVRGHIFIASADPERDLAVRYADEHRDRRLSGVIAHEVTHNLLRRAAGGRDLPTWKDEGYAEYVAGESTFDYDEGIRLLVAGGSDPSNAFRYFKHRLLVQHLLDDRGVPFEEFLRKPFDPWLLEAEMVRTLRGRRADLQ